MAVSSGAAVGAIGAAGAVTLGPAVIAAAGIGALVGATIAYYRLADNVNVPVQGAPGTSASQMPATTSENIWCGNSPCNTSNPLQSGSASGACSNWAHSSDGWACYSGGYSGTFSGSVTDTSGGVCKYNLYCNTANGQQNYLLNQSQTLYTGTGTYTKTTADGRPSLQKDTAGWSRDTTDPDTGAGTGAIPAGGSPLRVTGHDSAGNPVAVTLSPTPGNGVKMEHAVQTKDPNGNAQTTVRTVNTDSGGVVREAYQITYNNYSIDQSTGNITNLTTTTNTTGAPSSGSSSEVSNWPSDFPDAGTHTLLTTTNTKIDSTNTKLDTLHHDLTDTVTAPTDPTARTPEEISGVFYPDAFTSLLAWRLPARSVSCPTWTVSVWGGSYVIDGHCTLLAGLTSTIATLMLVTWAGLALFVVLSA